MVVTEGFRVFTGDIMTGRIQDIPVTSHSWGLRVNNSGTVTAKIPMFSAEAKALPIAEMTSSVRSLLGVAYNGTPLEAGPIWKRAYDATTGVLELTGAGIWSLLDARKAIPGSALVPGAKVTKALIRVQQRALGSIARELVRISIEDNPYPGGNLPIILPPVIAGTHQRDYNGYDLGWMGDRLRELTEVKNGPDIRFAPRYVDGDPTRLEWVMQHGTDTDPLLHQAGADWDWDVSVPEAGVTGLSVTEDATGLAAKTWVPGSGQEAAMLLASQMDLTLVNAGYPWLEADKALKDIEDQSILQDAAAQGQEDAANPWETWSLSVRADTDPTLGKYLPGDFATVQTPLDHPIIRHRRARIRIMSVDGDNTNSVRLGIAPIISDLTPDTGNTITTTKPSPGALYPGTGTFPSKTTYPTGAVSELAPVE